MRTAMLAVTPVALLAAACPTRTLALIETDQAKEEVKDVPAELNRNVDILFVVDNSGSMAAEQASVRANFQRFMDVLEAIEGGLPSVHIGVVSSDVGVGHDLAGACNPMGDDGRLRTGKTSCPMVMGRYISDEEAAGGRQRNYSGSLADAFSCMADLGTAGCGLEQHLEAVRLALDPQANPQNAGFLRPDAYLAVVFLADEDDCSAADRSVFAPGDDVAGALGPVGFRCARWGVTCDGSEIATTPGTAYGECSSWDGSPYMRHPRDYVAFLGGLKPDPALVLVAAPSRSR